MRVRSQTQILEGSPVKVGEREFVPLARVARARSSIRIKPVAVLERSGGAEISRLNIHGGNNKGLYLLALLPLAFQIVFRLAVQRRLR